MGTDGTDGTEERQTADHETYDLGLLETAGTPEAPVDRRRPPSRGRALLVLGVLGLAVAAGVVARSVAPQSHPLPHSHPAPPTEVAPAPGPLLETSGPPALPVTYRSGVLLVSAGFDLSHGGRSTLSARTTRPGPDLVVRCPQRMSGSAQYEIRVNGHLVLGSGCSAPDPDGTLGRVEGAVDASAAPTSWASLGVRLGQTVTVVITVTRPSFATTPAPVMSVGLYQAR